MSSFSKSLKGIWLSRTTQLERKPRFQCLLVLVQTSHWFRLTTHVTHGDTVPFVINGAGEYEVKGIDIVGVSSETLLGKEEKINTSYIVTIDDMKLCLLGGLSDEKSVTDIKAKAGDIDILFLPVGEFMNPSDAQKVAVLLEPSIVLPMSYDKDSLAKFLKENESHEKLDKLTIRKKDLAGREGDVVVLEY